MPLSRWLRPPVFESEEETQRARMFRYVVWTVMLAATTALGGVALSQPDVARRALLAIAYNDVLGLALLALSRRGQTRLASILFVLGLITLTTTLAPGAGGIRSPGVVMYFAFVLTAGVLLGGRAAVATAALCALLAVGLVAAELSGLLTSQPVSPYGPIAYLLLNLLYMALVMALSRLASSSTVKALRRAEAELAERKQAEQERERVLFDLNERVKELRLLHAAARLLRERSPFDPAMLQELVDMMPAAWKHPECCEARITFRDRTAQTAGWRESPWRLASEIQTTEGGGRIEVVYTEARPDADEGPFLKEERELIDSLVEMLVAYLESEHGTRRRHTLEAQLRQSLKMDSLGTLAGGIAHDFNNILTAIGGNVDLALGDSTNPEVRASLEEVVRAHHRAKELVQRILVFSRQTEVVRKVISLRDVVEEALRLLRATLPPMIRVRTEFAGDLPAILGDSTQMHQIVMNLVTNAAYAMEGKTGGTLSVTLDRFTLSAAMESPVYDLQPGEYVRLSVQDTGAGMSDAVMDRLFEPFFSTKGAAGTGLGLSMVHGIVRDHEGGIQVESVPGGGTTFNIFLPAAGGVEPDEGEAEDAVVGHGERIIYVDDEESIMLVMCRLLGRLGYECTGYTSAGEALIDFRADPGGYDAVITDLAMPGMTGPDLARALKTIRPELPVAIATGYGGGAAIEGVDAWIHKPPTNAELSRVVAKLLRGPGTDPA